MKIMRVFDKYHTKYINTQKAQYNEPVSQLMQQHYHQLHTLVKTVEDEDTFNDTFLKLTYSYNPDDDFTEQFKYQFNLLKGKYYRYDKTLNYCQIPENISEDDEEPVKMNSKQILKKVIDYAISQQIQTAKVD